LKDSAGTSCPILDKLFQQDLRQDDRDTIHAFSTSRCQAGPPVRKPSHGGDFVSSRRAEHGRSRVIHIVPQVAIIRAYGLQCPAAVVGARFVATPWKGADNGF
jgi:hypothetical protein